MGENTLKYVSNAKDGKCIIIHNNYQYMDYSQQNTKYNSNSILRQVCMQCIKSSTIYACGPPSNHKRHCSLLPLAESISIHNLDQTLSLLSSWQWSLLWTLQDKRMTKGPCQRKQEQSCHDYFRRFHHNQLEKDHGCMNHHNFI